MLAPFPACSLNQISADLGIPTDSTKSGKTLGASDRFVMMSLDACYAAQSIGAYRALHMVNPMPCTLRVIS